MKGKNYHVSNSICFCSGFVSRILLDFCYIETIRFDASVSVHPLNR